MEIPTQHDHAHTNIITLPKETNQNVRTAAKIGAWTLGILLVTVAVFGVLTHQAANSLPGQSLYSFKTEIAEPTIRTTKLATESRVRYDLTLLEQRVQELTVIVADTGTTSPEQIAAIAALASEHAHDAVTRLEKNQSLSGETRITLLAKLDTAARAAETLSDSFVELDSMNDAAGETENVLNEALKTAVATFVTNNATDTIQSFIASNLTEVSAHIGDVAPGSRAQGLAIRRIGETEEAIVDGKFADAILAIIRAQQAIVVDGYLFDSERGPVDGVTVEAGPVPEGN